MIELNEMTFEVHGGAQPLVLTLDELRTLNRDDAIDAERLKIGENLLCDGFTLRRIE